MTRKLVINTPYCNICEEYKKPTDCWMDNEGKVVVAWGCSVSTHKTEYTDISELAEKARTV